MRNCVYFVENGGEVPGAAVLAGGFGFRRDGSWRGGAAPAGAAGVLVDDRQPPGLRGAEAAAAALGAWEGWIVLDFERPPGPGAERLARLLAGKRAVVPPSMAALPHAAVVIGPWQGGGSFDCWLAAERARYGAVILDAAPLQARAAPGSPWQPWTGPLPEEGCPCAAGCLHRRLPDGSILFWDTRATLEQRCRNAGVPVILFEADLAGMKE